MVSTCHVRPQRYEKATVLVGAALNPRVNLDDEADHCFVPMIEHMLDLIFLSERLACSISKRYKAERTR
jgi:hypothetical protein